MAVRPPQIRYLTEGKALGAKIHAGFAATWNWLLSWVNFFKPGKGLKLAGTGSGHPRLDVELLSGDGIDVACGGPGQPYVISLTSNGCGCGGGGDPDEPFDPDEPWEPDDPWNPDDPWDPDDPDAPYDGGDDSGGGSDGGGSGNDCNQFSDEEMQESVDHGMENDGDNCGILNGW